MLIGIDASKISSKGRTGVEEYVTQVFRYLKKTDRGNQYILYTPNSHGADFDKMPSNFTLRELHFPLMWTQVRLAWELLFEKPDVFFEPSYATPLLTNLINRVPTVVTIHDVAYKYFPEAYPLWQRALLDFTTRMTVMRAKKIITISETT